MLAKFWLNQWGHSRWGGINREVGENRAAQLKIRLEGRAPLGVKYSSSHNITDQDHRNHLKLSRWNFEFVRKRYLCAEISWRESRFASASPLKWQKSCRISAWAFIEYITRRLLISHKLNSECNKIAIISKLIIYHFINCVQRDRLKVPKSFASSENFPNGFFPLAAAHCRSSILHLPVVAREQVEEKCRNYAGSLINRVCSNTPIEW